MSTGIDRVNPRWEMFLRAENTTMEEQSKRWPGGCMTGFICWIDERWAEWRAANAYPRHAPIGPREHDAFDRWLAAWVEAHHA